MPAAVLSEWLCSINRCETCWFRDKKEEYQSGRCTWYWLNEESGLQPITQAEQDTKGTHERPEQN